MEDRILSSMAVECAEWFTIDFRTTGCHAGCVSMPPVVKGPGSPRSKKTRQVVTTVKSLFVVDFDILGTVQQKFDSSWNTKLFLHRYSAVKTS
jgi:hypothetical protein